MNSSEVLVKFKGDVKDLDQQTGKAQKTLSGFSNAIKTGFKVAAVGVATVTAAVSGLVKSSVDAYAEFEQLEGGLVSLFGEGSKEMQDILKTSKNAWQDLTMSQNKYITSFQSSYPLVNAGLSENADAIEYTNKMMQISSDLFNTYGGSTEQYANAINWALKGSFVYLDNLNLGIKGTQEGFLQAANASGVLSKEVKNVKDLTSDEIIDVIQHYAEAYGVWGKTADEASTTILGSMNMVKASWQNMISGISQKDADISGLIDNLILSIEKFTDNIFPVIEKALNGIAKALPKLIQKIGAKLPKMIKDILPSLIKGVNALITALLKALPTLLDVGLPLIMTAIMEMINTLVQMAPEIITTLISSISTIITTLAQMLPTLMPKIVDAIIDGLLAIVDNIDLMIDAGLQLILGLTTGIINAIPRLIERVPEIIVKLVTALVKELPKFVSFGIDLVGSLLNGIMQVIGSIPTAFRNAFTQAWNAITGVFGNLATWFKNIFTNAWAGVKAVFSIGGKIFDGIKDGIVSVFKTIVNGIIGGINKVVAVPFNAINSVLSKLKGISILGVKPFGWVKTFSVPQIPKLATGTNYVPQDMLAVIHKGEAVVPKEFNPYANGINIPAIQTNAPKVQPIVNVYADFEMDSLGQVVSNIKTFSGGSKNDYNYGLS